MSPPVRCYQTRRSLTMAEVSSSRAQKSSSGPPKKKYKVSEPIDLTEPSSEPESEPWPSQPPIKKPQPSQPPAKESQIPSSMTPKVVIRRPMVTQPPIEDNLDWRARPFHSQLCFDTATFRLQPELRDSFYLLQRYHMEHLMTPKDFFYPPHGIGLLSVHDHTPGPGSYSHPFYHKRTPWYSGSPTYSRGTPYSLWAS